MIARAALPAAYGVPRQTCIAAKRVGSSSISGSRRDGTCGEGVSHYQLEITYSRFEKMIKFPRSIEHASIERDYRDGLLILRLREEQAKAARR